MSAVGRYEDNASAESIFGQMKRDRANHRQYQTLLEPRADLFDYIERINNPRKLPKLKHEKISQLYSTNLSVKLG